MNTQSNRHRTAIGVVPFAIGIAVCLIVSATVSGCSKAGPHPTPQDAKSLFATLHAQIKPGDSIQRVQELLGQGEPPQNREKFIAVVKKFAERLPQDYPAGVRDDDEFLRYSYQNLTVHLQFRAGRLLNFDPQKFEKVPDLQTMSP